MEKKQRGIQSIEVGGPLLLSLGRSSQPMSLKDLAYAAGMPPAKAHPYLVSFVNLGLVEQNPSTGKYELGPQTLQLGLSCLNRLDPVRIATEEIIALSERINHSVFLAVWGSHGPTVVRMEAAPYPLHINLRPGSVMSLLNTATGKIFAYYLPRKMVTAMMESEPGRLWGVGTDQKVDLDVLLNDVQQHGLARAEGSPLPGINAFSAPVFDYTNTIVLAITAVGTTATFDTNWDSPLAQAIRESAHSISYRLGYQATELKQQNQGRQL